MRHFHQFPVTFDVRPAMAELDAHSELWNLNDARTTLGQSPHAAADDIWLRWRAKHELVSRASYGEAHESVWWPASTVLLETKKLLAETARFLPPSDLGGVLLTRLPAGACIAPHHDRGSWHAEHYTQKLYLPLRSNPRAVNVTEDEAVVMAPGSLWSFDNLKTHSVHNDGPTERITLIICTRKIEA